MNTGLPRITVVTPSFNQGRFLEDCLCSIHGQDYPDLEHIVMDGGSTDGSVEIIRKYADRLAYWQSQPDGGQAAAIRAGFDRATGEVLCWLNSDDRLTPGALKAAGRVFSGRPEVQWLYGDTDIIDGEGSVLRTLEHFPFDYGILLYYDTIISQPACFWRRSLYERVGGLDPSYRCTMDFDLWLRMGRIALPLYVPGTLAEFRLWDDNKTRTLGFEFRREHRRAQIAALGGRVWPGQLLLGRWLHYARLQCKLLPRLGRRWRRRFGRGRCRDVLSLP